MNVIDWIQEKKVIDVYAFYEEVPIKVKIELHEIDFDKEQIIWSLNEKLLFALSKTKELYFEYNETIYVMGVIIYNKEEMVTTFPTVAAEPKLKRNHIRVQTSEEDPIYIKFDDYKIKAWDISEGGVGILLQKPDLFEIGKEYKFILEIFNKDFKVKGEVVYIKEIDKSNYKIGIKFINISPTLEDTIFKYILKRQKEILKKLSYFK
ncbi:flagellar brake protein [Hydrogenothermus marinus]|uniref:PilZ domain-containing protein n=1 Tax=Hydrogenothermus marinus TaxID=133270 RepID=A0A3M0BNT7_9AQUI|nr:PilZ domain-containing protein [Hydrogenothermus marinus]RMA97959.1 PilZ domain-containing protein [Hydrogenothermus marinus]